MKRDECVDELRVLAASLSLGELSTRFGQSPGQIAALLVEGGPGLEPADELALVLLEDDDEEASGGRRGRASKDHLIEAQRSLLGTVSDAQAARSIGVSMRTIAKYRAKYGISAYQGAGRQGAGGRPSKIAAFRDQVGQVADREIAELAGVTIHAVRAYRAKEGIAAYVPTSSEAAPVVAWRVCLQVEGASQTKVVLGTGLLEVATRLVEQGYEHLESVERVGDILALKR